jgi:predicted dehydrogenase
MSKKIRWGVLGAAKIATARVIPGMLKCEFAEIAAIASRQLSKAQAAAAQLGIPKAYGSYAELLADPDIDAIYNPLPNNMHVSWSIRAAEAGKHVLCEKPLSMDLDEVHELIAARDRTGVKIGEAFMVHTHPQWQRVDHMVAMGDIGQLRAMSCVFSYRNTDPDNIRNRKLMGGGALMDIGCYPIHIARWIFAQEPTRVCGMFDIDQEFGTDRIASALLDFPWGHVTFTCSTQMSPYQRIIFFGEFGRIEIEIPVNAPTDRETRILLYHPVFGDRIETFPVCDQYAIQGDAFSRAILDDTEVPVPLEDSLANMAVIVALFRSARNGQWCEIGPSNLVA